MTRFNTSVSGGRSVSGGTLNPRNNRGNSNQAAAYWAGGGGISFMVATGGTTTTYTLNGLLYKSHTFDSGGTFTVTDAGSTPTIDVLVMGGGGGGGNLYGGGGHGGYANTATQTLSATAYSVTVGGTGSQAATGGAQANGGAGGTSTFNGVSGAGGEGGITNNNNYSQQSGNITSDTYRTGVSESHAGGGYRAPTNSYGSGTYGRGGSGAMIYCNVHYYGGGGTGGVVIIRYRIE